MKNVKDKFFVIPIVILQCLASIITMNSMFYSAAASVEVGSSVVIYLITSILGIIYIFYVGLNIFKSKFVFSLLLYVGYFVFNSFFNNVNLSRIIANSAWVVISIIGFAIGYRNQRIEQINSIAKYAIIISLPLICVLISKYSLLNFGGEDVAKDAFFICSFLFPWAFLLKKTSLKQMVVIVLFLLFGLISLKRTLILVMVLAAFLYINFWMKQNSYGLVKRTIFFLALIFFAVLILGDSILTEQISGRFSNIVDDGGSGRDLIYALVLSDIAKYTPVELLFGRGLSSVSDLVGMDAHMDFLQIIHSLGLFGLLLYIYIYVNIVLSCLKYNRMKTCNDQLRYTPLITFLIFIIMANLNCFIFNPSFITPMMFVLSFQLGILFNRIKM